MFRFPSVICIRCTGFFYLAIIKDPPNDIYCIIEEPYKHYFTEKVSYSRSIWFYMCSTVQSPQTVLNGVINLLSHLCYQSKILVIS